MRCSLTMMFSMAIVQALACQFSVGVVLLGSPSLAKASLLGDAIAPKYSENRHQLQSSQLGLNQVGLLGVGAIASILAIGIAYQVRSSGGAAVANGSSRFSHPTLERPEQVPASLSIEAMSVSLLLEEVILTR